LTRAPRGSRAIAALGLAAMLLAACGHVPLRTMWALHHFSPRDLVGLDPAGLRAAVSVPDAWRLQPAGHALEIDMTIDGGGELKARVPLEVEVTLREAKDLEPFADAHWHVLKVTAAGLPELARAQAFIAAMPEGSKGSFALNVTPKLDPTPGSKARFEQGGDLGTLSVALKLEPTLGWLTLVDRYPLKSEPTKDAAKP
jgi:hypothetical protein